ncbi:UDP-glucose:glycoprotein glucosyltransferase 1 isoform X1 [Centruroides vittatus]|uniref:UDP-glucose:glycoprotein glucosyltransferase 1 isoform X1 n=1 Tax=Centruroides vittatus TaxID=120091 RepID=UPI0035107E97
MLRKIWLVYLCYIIINIGASVFCQKSVSVVLDSKWKYTPLHLETSEFLAEENNELFWRFISEVCKLGPGYLQNLSQQEQYEVILNITSKILSPARLALLKFSLSLRIHSPAVEMFHQIAYDKNLPTSCESVVEINNQFACNVEDLEKLLISAERDDVDIYKVDHHFKTLTSNSLIVILYGEIGTLSFNKFHQYLRNKAENQEIDYVMRHFVLNRSSEKVRLSGYGVELAIKSTEYKAQDDTKVKEDETTQTEEGNKQDEIEGFVFSKLKELYGDQKDKLEELRSHLVESTKEIATLKVWELQELSLQTAQRILSSSIEESLRIMGDVAQNFPIQARSLIHIGVSSDLKKEVEKNQQMFIQYHNIAPSDTALFINGMYFDMEVTDIFTLLQVLKQETRVIEGLHSVSVPESKISKLLKMDFIEDKQEYAIDIRDSAVQYINDIETDRHYKNWPGSVQDLLRPTYPGMLRNVRKNIYHLIIIADPSQSEAKDIFKLAESFYVHKAPVRIGIIFAANPDTSLNGFKNAGVALLNAFNFIAQDKTPYDGLSFITEVYATSEGKEFTPEIVKNHFHSKYPNEDLELIFGDDSDYDTGRRLAWDFINRTGIGNPPQVLINGVALKQSQLNVDMFEDAILTEVMRQTPFIQKSVYKGDLSDFHNVLDYLMSQKNVMPRLNQKILTPGKNFIDLTGVVVEGINQADLPHMSQKDFATTFAAHMNYLTKREEVVFRPLTWWIVGDLETPEGRELLNAALVHLKTSNEIRIGIVHNPLNPDSSKERIITKAVYVSTKVLNRNHAKLFITKLIKTTNAIQLLEGTRKPIDFALSDMNLDEYQASLEKEDDQFLAFHSVFARMVLGLAPGARAVVANGKIIGPFESGEEFLDDDFNLLEKFSMNVYGEKLSKELKGESETAEADSNIMMKATSVLLAQTNSRTRHDIKFYADKHSVLKIPASDSDEPAHELIAIVDPVSRGAQKLSAILLVLQRVINSHLKIFFNCIDKHSSMPLKSFFRFVLEPELHFTSSKQTVLGPMARFNKLPTTSLLTLGMITPENWMVESVRSPYDLDNIHLEQVESGIYAEFELEHLLIEGHCFEQTSGNPPRGLQFTLGTKTSPVMVDTIVMANLGYFQLKANPGSWLLRLRQGRSSDIYNVVSHEGTDSPSGSTEVVVIISNFRSHIIKIRVNKKPGKQYEELLYDDEEDSRSGIWNTITSIPIIGGIITEWEEIWKALSSSFSGDSKNKDEEEDNKINIFSLASGHLYERLLRIMMLSVLKNTQTPVKFWFLKNYLSPTFKDFLPLMAQKYNFQYELVQYKWPRWLNQQTEKQRLIWGYKILFLDVLFPLDIKKIIFVDADQVVRGDMKELRDLDLGGAPYGYTPFCDSRTDMDGYRFWKSGYWASHLAGRKYHISALYVVDLKKFRRIAAGDRLRGQYQGLSQDPNSLANLDQDLPNNMIHQVNIKSLPQEWLWCETWCDDKSKQYAKTIDLCNNPKTKEPKLVSAMRIIPEWKDYDTEIKQLFEQYKEGKVSTKLQSDHDKHEEL